MQPKMTSERRIHTDLGSFDVETWGGVNLSGFVPEGDRVLILPDQASEQTMGGITLPEETRERITAASETGILVAIGPEAFVWNSSRSRRRETPPPAAGVRVFFERYAGYILHGHDGLIYRVMDDNAIGAIEAPVATETAAA